MGIFNNLFKSGIGRTLVSLGSMFAGKIIADKMTRKVLKQQTGFETTDEIVADAQARAAKAQAEAEARAKACQAQAEAANTPAEK